MSLFLCVSLRLMPDMIRRLCPLRCYHRTKHVHEARATSTVSRANHRAPQQRRRGAARCSRAVRPQVCRLMRRASSRGNSLPPSIRRCKRDVYICTHTCRHTYIHTHTHTHTVFMFTMYIYVYIYMCIYTHTQVCVCVCVCFVYLCITHTH